VFSLVVSYFAFELLVALLDVRDFTCDLLLKTIELHRQRLN